ncbi:MAG TPA: winged helix-turn-helix domain-containing protein [Candidatus Dormibacteraeota bacterium]|nr:winged helix-turn-helix domain-containing protein [Candidatus Dormibacteraeota bacterium]
MNLDRTVSSSRELDEPLPGEDPGTEWSDDARHWLNIYRELVAFQEGFLARLQVHASNGRGGPALAEAIGRARARLEVLIHRRELWRRRLMELAGLEYDASTRTIAHGGRSRRLSVREAELLEVLLYHPGQHFRADQLLRRAWGGYLLSPEQLRVYVSRLRRRLAEIEAPCHLEYRLQHGYALVLRQSEPPAGVRAP